MNGSNVGARTKGPTHTFMGDDDSLFFRADENSQSGSSFPESGTSLQSVLSHHITHATHATIGKEDSGDISHCEHTLSGVYHRYWHCVCPHHVTHTQNESSNFDARTTRDTHKK
jgi:hypothetical protein